MTGALGRRNRLLGACALVATAALVWACSDQGSAPGDARPRATTSPTSAQALRDGSLVSANSLANTRIGGPFQTALSYRFRAEWSGSVSGVRFYIVTNPSDRSGYSGGTGGTLRVTIEPDSGRRHVPSGVPIASQTLRTPNRGAFPLLQFAQPAQVVAGRLYHVVFTNVDPDPRRNYISVNALLSRDDGGLRRGLTGGYDVLLRAARDNGSDVTRWFPRSDDRDERYIPILDVVGNGEQHSGIGYMEVWVGNPKPIGGSRGVRQLFGAPAGRRITGAWLRVRRTKATSVPLQLSIQRAEGETLTTGNVSARAVPREGPGWVRVRFRKPVTAPAGTLIALTAKSRGGRAYEAYPIRKGTEFGFDPSTVFEGGYAQFSEGDSWIGWDQWGARDRRDGDLQFKIETAAD